MVAIFVARYISFMENDFDNLPAGRFRRARRGRERTGEACFEEGTQASITGPSGTDEKQSKSRARAESKQSKGSKRAGWDSSAQSYIHGEPLSGGGDNIDIMTDREIGVLICCGRRLVWIPQEGTSVLEASCDRCGTDYAMDPGDELVCEEELVSAQPSDMCGPSTGPKLSGSYRNA